MDSTDKKISPTLSVIGCTTRIWFDLLRRYGFEARFLHRVLFGSCITLALAPLRLYERLKLRGAIERTVVNDSPVFILGHWRSGTTLLHNVLSKDPSFGYVTYEHGLFPHCFLTNNIVARVAQTVMPRTRPMDNMEISIESPQEEEQALVALCGHSVYNMWIAPKQHMECWNNYGLLKNPTAKENWSRGYSQLLSCASYQFGGKRLLLKNPANTARIPYLLDKFPNAKFIYIYRNPYAVYESTKNLYRKAGPFFHLSDVDHDVQDRNILRIYREMIAEYHHTRKLIPPNQLVEIKYEDFIQDQESGIESIYTDLGLGDFQKIAPILNDYLESIKNYVPNKFQPDQQTIDLVNNNLDLVFELHQYEKIQNR